MSAVSTVSAKTAKGDKSAKPTKPKQATKSKATTQQISGTFITKFKKLTGLTLSPIETYNNYNTYKDLFNIKPDIRINAYVKDVNNLLLVAYMNRGRLRDGYMSYEQDITDSDLFNDDEVMNTDDIHNLYVVIIRNETTYKVFHYDFVANSQDAVEYQPNYQLNKLAEAFNMPVVGMSNGEARSEFGKIVDTIWAGTGFGSDQRIAFNVITWILLSHDELPFKTSPDGKQYSLKQCIEINRIHSEKIGTEEANTEEFKAIDELLKSINPVEIINAFERVISWKMATHQSVQTTAELRINNKQAAQLRKTIEGLYTKKSERNALMIATNIYDRLYSKNPDLDINKLAFEYENKWNNRTAQTVVSDKGQVYTHHMLKDLIMCIFGRNINDGAICYDPTCGTGGFTEHFYKYCSSHNIKNILAYGNEIDEDSSNMAWISGLCSDQDVRVFNLNCFDPEIKTDLIPKNSVDFLLMNPPYGMDKNDKKVELPYGFDWSEDPRFGRKKPALSVWTFCRYNMDSFLKPGGWFAYVIPVSSVSENKSNRYNKRQMLDTCEIWYVIRIREDIFTPQAGKACCLVIGRYLKGLRTAEEKNTWKTKCVDFSKDCGTKEGVNSPIIYNDMKELEKLWYERILDNKCLDGFCETANTEELKSILYEPNSEGQEWYEERVLTPEMDWIFRRREESQLVDQHEESQLVDQSEEFQLVDQHKEFHEYLIKRITSWSLISSNNINWSIFHKPENKDCEWRKVMIPTLFNLIGRGKMNVHGNKPGPYPLISSGAENNGIVDKIDSYKFGENENDYHITVAANGSCGTCFLQKGYFNATSDVIILHTKPEYDYLTERDYDKLVLLMTEQFQSNYNWHYKFGNGKVLNESFYLPFDKKTGKIDFSITNIFECEVEHEV